MSRSHAPTVVCETREIKDIECELEKQRVFVLPSHERAAQNRAPTAATRATTPQHNHSIILGETGRVERKREKKECEYWQPTMCQHLRRLE
jgi:hypothetical protein